MARIINLLTILLSILFDCRLIVLGFFFSSSCLIFVHSVSPQTEMSKCPVLKERLNISLFTNFVI